MKQTPPDDAIFDQTTIETSTFPLLAFLRDQIQVLVNISKI